MSLSHDISKAVTQALTRAWYKPGLSSFLIPLLPLSALVRREAGRRYRAFQDDPPSSPGMPVIVVGNVTVGGTGKTPLVAALVDRLQKEGYRPGIISRGYGAGCAEESRLVIADSDPSECGDEPVMLASLTGVPVIVDAVRSRAVDYLGSHTDCNLIISDDGLQHYGLYRDIEIVVIDGARMLGNGRCLPAGPLRESADRLSDVDFIVCNGEPERPLSSVTSKMLDTMILEPGALRPVAVNQSKVPAQVQAQIQAAPTAGERVHAVAGIGNPERFFNTLTAAGFQLDTHPFPDHYEFTPSDLSSLSDGAVIMTAKDAVKCRGFASDHCWYLPVAAQISDGFWERLLNRLSQIHA